MPKRLGMLERIAAHDALIAAGQAPKPRRGPGRPKKEPVAPLPPRERPPDFTETQLPAIDLAPIIADYAATELLRRLMTAGERSKIGANVLSQILVAELKRVEDLRDPAAALPKPQHVTILQIVQQPGLPLYRRVELLVRAARNPEAKKELAKIQAVLAELVGEREAIELLAIEEGDNGYVYE